MAAPRKIFRIEETAAARLDRDTGGSASAAVPDTEVMQELRALRELLAAPAPHSAKADGAPRSATERLTSELNLIAGAMGGGAGRGGNAPVGAAHLTRIAHELDAVTAGTEQATQKILAAAEEIDQLANNLSAALKGKIEQGLAQDISDLVIRIFAACNFQDLIGQRVTKVMTTVKFIEDHIGRVLDEIKSPPPARQPDDAAQYLHGPRLDSDSGHVTQSEIDALFGG